MIALLNEYFEHMIKSGQSFNEHVSSFIAKLVTSGNKKVQSAIDIEIQVPATNKNLSYHDTVDGTSVLHTHRNVHGQTH